MTLRDKQRLAALKKANHVRTQRSQLKKDVKKGDVDVIALIRGELPELTPLIESWTLHHVLELVPGVGPVSEQEIYLLGTFTPTIRFDALGAARRGQLADLCKLAMKKRG